MKILKWFKAGDVIPDGSEYTGTSKEVCIGVRDCGVPTSISLPTLPPVLKYETHLLWFVPTPLSQYNISSLDTSVGTTSQVETNLLEANKLLKETLIDLETRLDLECRLNGQGAERELRLMARIAELEKQLLQETK